MAFLIIGLILVTAFAGWMTRQYMKLRRELAKMDARCRDLQKQRAIRQNLQRICDGRGDEIRRLRAREAEHVAAIRELEDKASELNVSLFRESGLRILAEKEDGARQMRMELMEKQLNEARAQLKAQEEQAAGSEQMYQNIIAERDAEIARLQTAQARRAARRARSDTALDQISLDDIMGTVCKENGGRHSGRKNSGTVSQND